jgi:C4-type Zn-finger protein
MAILETPVVSGKCPKCGSRDVKVEFKRIECSKASVIMKKRIKCNSCGYSG